MKYKYIILALFLLFLGLQTYCTLDEITIHNKGAGWDGKRYLEIAKRGLINLKDRNGNWHVIKSYIPAIFYNFGVIIFDFPIHSSPIVKFFRIYAFVINIIIFFSLNKFLNLLTTNHKAKILSLILFLFNFSIIKLNMFDPLGRDQTSVLLVIWGMIFIFRKQFILFTILSVIFYFNHPIICLMLVLFSIFGFGTTQNLHTNQWNFNDFRITTISFNSRIFDVGWFVAIFVYVALLIALIYNDLFYNYLCSSYLYEYHTPIKNSKIIFIFTFIVNVGVILYFLNIVRFIFRNITKIEILISRNLILILLLLFLLLIEVLGGIYYFGKTSSVSSVRDFLYLMGMKPLDSIFSHTYWWGIVFILVLFNFKKLIKQFYSHSTILNLGFLALILLLLIMPESRALNAAIFLFIPFFVWILEKKKLTTEILIKLLFVNILFSRFYLLLNGNSHLYYANYGVFNDEYGFMFKSFLTLIYITSIVLLTNIFRKDAHRDFNKSQQVY